MQGSQLMTEDDLIPQGKGGENAGHRKERENPAQQPSARSGSVLLSTVSPAQQPLMTTVATMMTFILLSPRTVTAMVAISRGPRNSCWPLRLGREQVRGTADVPPCVHWGPDGESSRPRHSPWSWCCRTEHAGHGEHAALSAVGIAAAPFLHSKSTLWGVGPDAAKEASARRLVTETPVTTWTAADPASSREPFPSGSFTLCKFANKWGV